VTALAFTLTHFDDAAMKSSKWSSTFLLLLLTAVMLPLCFPPFYCAFLAPIALAPFTIVIVRRPLNVRHLLAYYALGAAFFVPNLFWLSPVTFGGYLALALFMALYFPVYAFAARRLIVDLRLPATLGIPIAWTVVEYLRSTLFWGGFPWFHLGNSLAPVPLLIQIADLFGVWGVTFLLALCNGLVVDLLRLPLFKFDAARQRRGFNPQLGAMIATTIIAIVFTVTYGVVRLNQPSAITEGPRIAVLQENIPQKVKDAPTSASEVFIRHAKLMQLAARAEPKPDLIVWPETTVPGYTNPEYLAAPREQLGKFEGGSDGYWLALQERSRQFDEYLRDFVRLRNTQLLVGAAGLVPLGPDGGNYSDSIKQNRAALFGFNQNGEVHQLQEYAKRHLVPFGEFVPFQSIPPLHRLLLRLTPYGIDYSNDPGTTWTRFELHLSRTTTTAPATQRVSDRPFTFGVPICFEDVMPYPSREMVKPDAATGGRKADFLLNISNEGWFLSPELDQHLQAAQLRAVENRVPMARAVNSGNSGFIDSHGRILKLVTGDDGKSRGAVGYATLALPLDSRISLYTRIGDLFPVVLGILAALCVGWTFLRPRRKPTTDTDEVEP